MYQQIHSMSIKTLSAIVPSFAGFIACIVTGGLLYTDSALAQAQSGRSAQTLEEIVVTARRRDESLQKIPISMSALSSLELDVRNVTNLLHMNTMVPNLVISGKGPAAGNQEGMFVVRGIGASRSGITDDPRVPTYLDGVYLGQADGALIDVVNVERIEVLRGPQGTLFGKNALSGAIHYVSQQPGKELGGRAKVTVGRFSRIDVAGHVDIPLSENVFSRIAAAVKDDDGNGKSVLTGRRLGDVGTRFISGEILWEASENFQARFAADFTSEENNGPLSELITLDPNDPVYALAGFPQIVTLYNGLAPLGITPVFNDANFKVDEFQVRGSEETRFNHDVWGVRLNLDWVVNDWLTLKSLTSHREYDSDRLYDLDGTEFDMFIENHTRRDYEQFQQEIQAHGNNLDGRLNWVLGGFYFSSEMFWSRARGIACELVAAQPFPPFIPAQVAGIVARFPSCAGPLPVQALHREVDSLAIFGEATYAINDTYSLTFGLRWSSEEILDEGSDSGLSGTNEDTFEEVTPRVSLQAQWTDDLMTYISYSEGFRSGGANNRANTLLPNNGFITFGPERLESYEFGIKSQFFDNRLQLNAAGFIQDWEDIQVEVAVNSPRGPQNFFQNAGSGKADGFEIEAIALVAEGWRLNASVGYTDSGYESLDPDVTIAGSIALDTPFAEAPEWTYSLGGQWEYQPSFGGSFTTRVDYGWQDERQLNAGIFLAIQDESFGLLRANVTYEAPSGRWSVSAFGTNLTDERYFITGLAGSGQVPAIGTYGRQREWGVSLSVNF